MNILVTGGAGYIGSHTAVELLNKDHEVIIVDNLCNSSFEAINRIEKITGKKVKFYEIDLCNKTELEKVFIENSIDSVIHFAGLKAVGESVQKPTLYYKNNIDSTLSLLDLMDKYNVEKIVFSSSATVYGNAAIPYVETSITGQGITNPYGQTKFMIEQIIKDYAVNHSNGSFVMLRYFNPIGAHASGLIGEDPKGIPNNLMPFISQVASGKRAKLSIFGGDYPTPDGTCIRDYIHVVDLAKAHVAAVSNDLPGFNVFNLGSGKGTSVLELVTAFEIVTGQNIPYEIVDRRAGDLPEFYANPSKANATLNWKTQKTIEDMCHDSWNWQSKNPDGYPSDSKYL